MFLYPKSDIFRTTLHPIFFAQSISPLLHVIKFLLYKHTQSFVICEFFSFSEITFYVHVYIRGLFEFLNINAKQYEVHPSNIRVRGEFLECNSISWKSEIPRRRGYHSRSVIDQWIIS